MKLSITLRTGMSLGGLGIIGVVKALNLRKSNSEKREQCYHWYRKSFGDNHYENGKILRAVNCWQETICCFTEAFLGLNQYATVNGNDYGAQRSLLRLKDVTSSICSWKDVGKLRKMILENRGQGYSTRRKGCSKRGKGGSSSLSPLKSSKTSDVSLIRGGGGASIVIFLFEALVQEIENAWFKRRGELKGGGGSKDLARNESGSDDGHGDPWYERWKKMKKEAPMVLQYKGNYYYQSKCGNYWYVRDKAGHGGAILKKYKDTRSYLEFTVSVDKKFKEMIGKHESNTELRIQKSKMRRIR